jgi:hypothetical protein
MDSHKDFIHIDDLFKDLRNGEEQERPGAWTHMKDLLDKELPVGGAVSGGRSFRRFIVPLLAAAVLLGGGITYYQVTNDNNNIAGYSKDKAQHIASANVPGTASGYGTGHAAKNGGKGAAGMETTKLSTGPGSMSAGNTGNVPDNNTSVIPATTDTRSSKNNNAATKTQQEPAGRNERNTVSGKNLTDKNIAGKDAGLMKVQPAQAKAATAKPQERQHVIEEIKPEAKPAPSGLMASNTPGRKDAKSNSTSGSNAGSGLTPVASGFANKTIVQAADGNLYKEERDTFKRIDVLERYSYNASNKKSKPKITIDTVAITRVEKIRYVALSRMELLAFRQMNVDMRNVKTLVPVADLHARTVSKEFVNLVPLNKYKVDSRRVDPGKFNKLIQNTAGGIANYFDGSRKFYLAVLAGGNTSFGNPGAFGMQLGIAGLYSLGERWTLAAEFKFVNHYFSNYTLNDQSVSYGNVNKEQTGGGSWLFSGTEYTSTSAYKINSFNSLEMPVTLSYNLGRVSLFGGVNLAYAFPVGWNKETSYNEVSVEKQLTQDKNPFENKSFLFDEKSDFGSRFGVGYVFGLNYDLSRKVSLDARMTQILWDNAQGNIDAINRLFRMPTLQLSIGYYFGRKEKVVYIMNDRK